MRFLLSSFLSLVRCVVGLFVVGVVGVVVVGWVVGVVVLFVLFCIVVCRLLVIVWFIVKFVVRLVFVFVMLFLLCVVSGSDLVVWYCVKCCMLLVMFMLMWWFSVVCSLFGSVMLDIWKLLSVKLYCVNCGSSVLCILFDISIWLVVRLRNGMLDLLNVVVIVFMMMGVSCVLILLMV